MLYCFIDMISVELQAMNTHTANKETLALKAVRFVRINYLHGWMFLITAAGLG